MIFSPFLLVSLLVCDESISFVCLHFDIRVVLLLQVQKMTHVLDFESIFRAVGGVEGFEGSLCSRHDGKGKMSGQKTRQEHFCVVCCALLQMNLSIGQSYDGSSSEPHI